MSVLCGCDAADQLQGPATVAVFHHGAGKDHSEADFRQLRETPAEDHIGRQTGATSGVNAVYEYGDLNGRLLSFTAASSGPPVLEPDASRSLSVR